MLAAKIKPGDSLALSMTWSSGGALVDLAGYDVSAQLRRRNDTTVGAPVATLSCTVDPDQEASRGAFTVVATSSATLAWTPGIYDCDVYFVGADDARHSETFAIEVERAITR